MHSDTLVVLIHGFCRTAENMQFWRQCLESDFPHIITPDLPATHSSFEECLAVLSSSIAAAQPEKYSKLYFACHSMGGLLAREYLARYKPQNARRLVCAGTPHLGSKLADISLLLPGAGLIWKPLKALKRSVRKTITQPDIPGLEIGLVIGTNNAHWPGKLFLSKSADGLVESFSAHAPDAKCTVYTQVPHAPMPYARETADLIKKFLLNGEF
jgi:pimeloyl-ACP methyl ester carboxylesterase